MIDWFSHTSRFSFFSDKGHPNILDNNIPVKEMNHRLLRIVIEVIASLFGLVFSLSFRLK